MSLTLNSTLQTQLDGITRNPICKIISESIGAAIPFPGISLALSDSDEFNPDLVRLSTGQLAMVYQSSSNQIFNVNITDITRSYWNQYAITTNDNYALYNPSICEMSNGNLLIAYVYDAGSTHYLRTWIIDINGDNVSSSSNTVTFFTDSILTYQDHYLIYDSDVQLYYIFYTYETISGSTYTLRYRSSSDGITWGSPNDITLTGISSSNIIRNIHAMQASDDDIIITFEYEYDSDPVSGWETMNIYYAVSQDNCSTWSTPTQVTSYDEFGTSGVQPQIEIKDNGTVYVTFSENIGVSYFDENTSGVLSDLLSGAVWPQDVHMYNGYLYIVSTWAYSGTKELGGMYVVDPTDMSIVRQYTQTTSPGFTQSFWSVNHTWFGYLNGGAGKYMATATWGVGSYGGCTGVVAVATYDGIIDTTEEYVFDGDLGAYGLVKNVETDQHTDDIPYPFKLEISGCAVDETNDKLYVLFTEKANIFAIKIGYIDLTETKDPVSGLYTWNEIYFALADDICSAYDLPSYYDQCFGFWPVSFEYCANDDVLVYTGYRVYGGSEYIGAVLVLSSNGVVQAVKAYGNDTRFPRYGPFRAHIYDGIMYADFGYITGYDQEDYRGMLVWDMITDTVHIDRPNYATQDEYSIYDMDFSDISNGNIWMAMSDGAAVYNIASRNWTLYNEDNTPGFGGPVSLSSKTDIVNCITYDSGTENVYAGGGEWAHWYGMRKFNINGNYYIGQYATGTKSGTDLGFGTINTFTVPTMETDIALVSDSDNVLWTYWNHYDPIDDDYDIYWGTDAGSIDISDDLLKGSEVLITWDVEYPTTLTFTCARGHLYDQHNSLSSLNYVFRRGRKITVQFGENISDTEYWQNQGSFICEETDLQYKRGDHPAITVNCSTMQTIWMEHTLVTTDYYDGQSPQTIVEDLLDSWTVLDGAEYDISAFNNTHTIWNQWTDITFWDVLKAILDHFGYIGYFDVDGVFVNKRVQFDKAIDHTYSDSTHIETFTPHSGYGSFVNQVRVIGETHNKIEVLYESEQVGSYNGTLGWWCETEVKRIYYSDDQTVMGRNPQLDVVISLADFQYLIFKGGGQEYISYVDPNNLYCEVTLIGPNLIGAVAALATSVVALGYGAVTCTLSCGWYIFGTNVTISLLIYALLAVANWAFNLWVQPVGEMKQTVQYLAEDTTFQDELNGQPVCEEIEDPLCYSVDQCQSVAEFEIDVARYQRNRLQFSKLAHLQDEILDKLRIIHPFSGQNTDLIITNLTRRLVIGGEMMDDIEGWRIN